MKKVKTIDFTTAKYDREYSNQYVKSLNQIEVHRVCPTPSHIIHSEVKSPIIRRKCKKCLELTTGKMYTGLIPLRDNYYLGDTYIQGKKSILIVKFTPSMEHLFICLYRGFDKRNTKTRKDFALKEIPRIEKYLENKKGLNKEPLSKFNGYG